MIDNRNIIDTLFNFMNVKGIGSVQTNKLILSLEDNLSILPIYDRARSLLNQNQWEEFEQSKNQNVKITSKFPVKFISIKDLDYPTTLKTCLKSSSPPILSVIGNINLLNKKKVAFSGSRKVSEKGISITIDCVDQLLENDVCIVSGNAKGVDFSAHETALKKGGSTIIVIPEGINQFRIKKEWKEIWDWNRVLVISEFQPNEKWMASRAMKRNSTIIGLSDIVVVVEAGITGGSLDAGEKTLQFGKYLFVPHFGDAPESALGNIHLIKRGAIPIKMQKSTMKPNLVKMLDILNQRTFYTLFS